VDGVLEALRSGTLVLREGSREVPNLAVGAGSAEDLTLVVRAWRTEPPADLYRAEIEARYTVLGEPGELTVETLFWKPGGPKVE
jgi:hypothetical protein